ncbi:MAG: hypothetical protein J2P31_06145 [Blastocatellia bacterium]|nr:hypothetical protein [Blastocatellia bacterium]
MIPSVCGTIFSRDFLNYTFPASMLVQQPRDERYRQKADGSYEEADRRKSYRRAAYM